jgi:hypothetical protein
MIDPLASILIGVSLFGDQLRTSGAWGPLEALSLLVLFAGALLLCRSPLVRGVKGSESEDQVLLSLRWRTQRAAHDVEPSPVIPPPATGH